MQGHMDMVCEKAADFTKNMETEGLDLMIDATYISQTTTVVGPKLSRIGKCRSLILKQTVGELDVLDDSSLKGYKRFFGDS